MSETHDSLRIRALEIAAAVGDSTAEQTVQRATAYHKFLSPVASATSQQPASSNAKGDTSATGTAGKAPNKPAASGGKPAAASGGKPAAASGGKPAAAGKPAAQNRPAASKQNVGGQDAYPPGDTKAPGARHDFDAMCAKLRAVMKDETNGGREEATRILAEDGNGATSVRNLKPELYDAVAEACDNVLNPGGGGESDGAEGDGADII